MDKFDKYIGRLLDNRYEILEVIGTGGMAVVYKARCHRLNRLVAIKILKSDYLEDEDFRRRFHAESQAVAMLSHPNIVSVYDVSTSVSMESDYIVMELIEGITLKQYMETKGYLNWKETLHFGIQIAKALDHAHSRGIVHRDIKPHNIMVLKNGSVKVTDFGIARLMSKGNTLTKEALGSVHYISPEQAKGGRVDNRSDIYSLGVVMYEMMAGRPPYDGDSPVAVAIQHINGGAPLPSTLNPNIPGGLEQIIMKAMSNEPADRYTGAAQMLHDMDEFRKDPTILFDYNTPPLDAVTNLHVVTPPPAAPEVVVPPRTTAERVVNRAEAQKRAASGPKAGNAQPARAETPKRTAAAAGGSGVVRNADAQRKAKAAAEERRKREQEEQARNRVAIIAIIICALVAVIAIVVFLVVLLGGSGSDVETIMVPKLVGEQYEEVEDLYPDIQIKLLEEVYDENAPAGTILEQDPVAGTPVEPGKMVFVTVSLGAEPKAGTMSNLENYTEATAISYLERLDMDLKITVMQEFHDEIEEGKVIRTDPAEGSALEQGQEVFLYVSQGKEIQTIKMPDVVDVTEALAINTLERQEMDLKIETEEIYDADIAEGNVVKTVPEKGEDLKTGDTVILYISKGPKTTGMLDLENYTESQAKKALESLDMDLVIKTEQIHDNEIAKDKVVKTEPAAGKEIRSGQTVTLYISKGAATAEMINVVDMSESQAKNALEKLELDLVIKTEQVFDATIASGNVVKSDPAKGSQLTAGQTVTLYISKGVQTAKVPNVLGKSVETAIELIKYAGFPNPAVEYVYDDTVAEGTVITQSAEPDSQAPLTTVITLKVSKGPEIAEDPASVAYIPGKQEEWI